MSDEQIFRAWSESVSYGDALEPEKILKFARAIELLSASNAGVPHACALCGSTGDCKSTDARTLHECGGAWYRPAAPAQSGEPVAWVDEKAEVLVFGGWDKQPFAKSYRPVFYAADNDTLFARVTDWVNAHGIPFEPQNELFRILAASPQPVAQTAQSTDSEFKNFHRLLCERFGYAHDDKDWKRDQLSLIEWIARPAQCEEPAAWMNPNENFSKDTFLWAPDDWQSEYSVPVYAAPIAAQRAMTDEQREAIATSVTALTTLGWTHQIPVLIALLETAQPATGDDRAG